MFIKLVPLSVAKILIFIWAFNLGAKTTEIFWIGCQIFPSSQWRGADSLEQLRFARAQLIWLEDFFGTVFRTEYRSCQIWKKWMRLWQTYCSLMLCLDKRNVLESKAFACAQRAEQFLTSYLHRWQFVRCLLQIISLEVYFAVLNRRCDLEAGKIVHL
jgi:hypothetical protein